MKIELDPSYVLQAQEQHNLICQEVVLEGALIAKNTSDRKGKKKNSKN
jgi:hypothetical protein